MNPTIKDILFNLLLFSETIAALVGIVYFKKLKNSYWKWFVFYLVFIAVESVILKFFVFDIVVFLYDFLIVPIEFFFFYWLYAIKSLQNKKMFWTCVLLFLVTYIQHFFYKNQLKTINEITYIVGCMLLFVLVLFEFIKQIKSDDILLFKQNKMFYINVGVVLLYIGSLPLFAFKMYLYEFKKEIYICYAYYFYSSNILMYLLFAASFIWGKSKT
jgi:hypothetical protein